MKFKINLEKILFFIERYFSLYVYTRYSLIDPESATAHRLILKLYFLIEYLSGIEKISEPHIIVWKTLHFTVVPSSTFSIVNHDVLTPIHAGQYYTLRSNTHNNSRSQHHRRDNLQRAQNTHESQSRLCDMKIFRGPHKIYPRWYFHLGRPFLRLLFACLSLAYIL